MRRTLAIAGVLAAVAIALRLPLATAELWAWDSVLYARALEQGFRVDFDLAQQRPQAPGYVFYVALATLFYRLGADTNFALVLVSILASGLAIATVFLLARRFASEPLAVLAALAFACNPLVWHYGEVAYPYAMLGFLSALLAGLFWMTRGHPWGWLVASLALGTAAGFRQDLLLFLAPLWLWSVWPARWRERIGGGALVLVTSLTWLIPSVMLSQGRYFDALLRQSTGVGATYSIQSHGLDALLYNMRFTWTALSWGLLAVGLLLAALVVVSVARWISAGRPIRRPSGDATFFLLWMSPALLFYVTVHIGEWGYILSVLPAFYVVTAALLHRHRALYAHAGRIAPTVAVVALLLTPAVMFLTGTGLFGRAMLSQHDRAINLRVAYVRENFDARRTIILAREDYLHIGYYLPEYRIWRYDPQLHVIGKSGTQRRTMETTAIVVFTQGLQPARALDIQYVQFEPGMRLAYARFEPGTVLELFGERYSIQHSVRPLPQ